MAQSSAKGERRVVITGLGAVTPLGLGAEALWDGLLARRCGIRTIESFDASGLACTCGGEVAAFKMGEFVPKSYRKSTKVMARDIELAVVAAYQAVKDAGLKTKCLIDRKEVDGPANVDSTRFGANIGAGLICADLPELAGALASAVDEKGEFSLARWGREGMENLTPLWLLKFLPNMLACHVTIVHDCQAHSNTVTCADASSHLAIGEAFRTIARGAADVCLSGGAESKINPMGVARQQLLGRLSRDPDLAPERACRPFAADGGLVCSEGGGLVILEDLEHAQARGARIYAEVLGFGASSNTHDWMTPHPEGRGLSLACRKALDDAGLSPDDVGLLGTFGTGAPEYDASELRALRAVFGDRCEGMSALATKGSIGHNGAGAGAIDISATVMALYHGTLPPSLNTDGTGAEVRLGFVTDGPVDLPARVALTVGYALHGGQNAALVISKYQE
jgi:3-oxoacyl-[acyl-carrier-protein] synthase II